jgi:hypothetical protein
VIEYVGMCLLNGRVLDFLVNPMCRFSFLNSVVSTIPLQARSAKEAGKDGRHEQVLRMLENAHQFRANPQRGDGSAAQSNGASPTAVHSRNGQPHNAGEDVSSVEPRDPLLARQYAQRLIPLLARVTQVSCIPAGSRDWHFANS